MAQTGCGPSRMRPSRWCWLSSKSNEGPPEGSHSGDALELVPVCRCAVRKDSLHGGAGKTHRADVAVPEDSQEVESG